LAVQDTNPASAIGTGTSNRFRIRFVLDETNDKLASFTPTLYVSRNSGSFAGEETAVTGSSSVVQATLSSQYADGDTCSTQLLSAGSAGVFEGVGYADEVDGATAQSTIATKNDCFECEFCVYIVDADVNNSDTLDFRVYDAGSATDAYSVTPRITVAKVPIDYGVASISGTATVVAGASVTKSASASISGTATSTPTATVTGIYLWDERFEATGYDETWSIGETVTGSAVLDSDYPTSSVTNAPAWWGDKCLRIASVGGEDSYVLHRDWGGATDGLPIHYSRLEVIIESESLANSDSVHFLSTRDSQDEKFYQYILYKTSGGVLRIEAQIWYDGGSTNFESVDISVDTLYRLEMRWDITNTAWEWRVNDSTINSGTISGEGLNRPLDGVFLGDIGTQMDAASEIRLDNFTISTTGWVGAVATEVTGAASITGSATVAASASRILSASAAITATATTTATPSRGRTGVSAISGTATVNVTGGLMLLAVSNITGTATAGGLARLDLVGLADISGTATVNAVPSADRNNSASISGTATVTASPSKILTGVSSISGTATVNAVGTTGTIEQGAASISGTATVNAVPSKGVVGSSSISGTASVTAAPSLGIARTVAITGTATVSAAPTKVITGVADISGTATVNAAPVRDVGGACSVSGTATTTAAATLAYSASASISGTATVNAVGTVPSGILSTAIAWWHADRYDPSTDGQSWPDQSGNAHHAQLGSSSGADSNDPTFLPYDGTQYIGCYNSVGGLPDNRLQITNHPSTRYTSGDLEVELDVALNDWTVGGHYIFQKYNGSRIVYGVRVQSGGTFILYWNESGTQRFAESTAAPSVSDGDRLQIKVTLDIDNGASGYDVKFYTRVPGGSYSQLGSTVTGGATTSITDSTNDLNFGTVQAGIAVETCDLYRLTLRNGIDGTAFVDIDCTDEVNVTPGVASFTESSSNGDTVTVYRGTALEPVVVNRNLWLLTGDDYFEVADHADLDPGLTDDWTVYVAYRSLSVVSATRIILQKKQAQTNSAGNHGYYLRTGTTGEAQSMIQGDNDQWAYDALAGGSEVAGDIGSGFVRVAGSTLETFVDGTGSGSPDTDDLTAGMANPYPLLFGVDYNSGNYSYFYPGPVIAVAVFQSALSDTDMATLDTEIKADQTVSGGTIHSASASISGTATVNAPGSVEKAATASISGTATVSAAPSKTVIGVAAITGTATVSASSAVEKVATASISGTATVSAVGTVPTNILSTAIAWWHADRYDPSTDGQSWPDQSGNGHHAQFGSTGGADSNDPVFVDYSTEGEQGVFRPVSSDYSGSIWTADDAHARITGDQELHYDVALHDWVVASDQIFWVKRGSDADIDFTFGINNGYLFVTRRVSNTNVTYTSSAAISFTDGVRRKLRVTFDQDNGSSQSECRFYWRVLDTDGWTELGTAQTDANTGATDASDGWLNIIGMLSASAPVGVFYDIKAYSDLGSTLAHHSDFVNESLASNATSYVENSSNAVTMTITRNNVAEVGVVNRNLMYVENDDYFEVADHADLDFGAADDFTFAVAFRPIDNPTSTQYLIAKVEDDGSANPGYRIKQNSNETCTVYISESSNAAVDVTGDAGTGGSEVTVVGVRNTTDDDLEAFLNGTGTGSPGTDGTTATLANALPLRFGATSSATPSLYMTGGYLIAAAIFNTALSDADIAALDTELKADQTGGGTIHSATASVSGTATVSATATALFAASASVQGAASVNAVPSKDVPGAASISGTATVNAVGSVTGALSGVASISGTATVNAVGTRDVGGTASISGVATVNAVGSLAGAVSGVASISGTATVAAGASITLASTAAITGTATVSATGRTGTLEFGVATITGSATVNAAPTRVRTGASAIFGIGTTAADAVIDFGASASISATATIAEIHNVIRGASASITGTATLFGNLSNILVPSFVAMHKNEATMSLLLSNTDTVILNYVDYEVWDDA